MPRWRIVIEQWRRSTLLHSEADTIDAPGDQVIRAIQAAQLRWAETAGPEESLNIDVRRMPD